jgi:hypothetical protein
MPATPRQVTLVAAKASPGHTEEVPVQFSATSQIKGAERHTVAVPANASAGQAALDPVHFSATSHVDAEDRQMVFDDTNESEGQVVPVPLQFSATSQTPVAARHSVPAFPAGCWQLPDPSHWSSVHGLPSLEHDVPARLKQLSAASLQVLVHSAPPEHGSPVPLQTPFWQVSVWVQNNPSLQALPFGSLAVQFFAPSLHDSAQLPSPSGPGHGLVPDEQMPAEQVSAPLQNTPSSQSALVAQPHVMSAPTPLVHGTEPPVVLPIVTLDIVTVWTPADPQVTPICRTSPVEYAAIGRLRS